MKIKEFVQEFKNKGIKNTQYNPNAVAEYIQKTLDIKDYLPFAEKRELCKRVLDGSCKVVGNVVEVDSVSRYLLFTMAMISNYTDLTFESNDEEDPIDQYDMLCQSGLLNNVLDVIGGEYEVCNNILNMMMADINANNNNAVAVLDKMSSRILDKVDRLVEALADKVEEFNLDLSSLDIEKYSGLLEKFTMK